MQMLEINKMLIVKSSYCVLLFGVLQVYSRSSQTDAYNYKHHNNYEVLKILSDVKKSCPKITRTFSLTERSVLGKKMFGIVFGLSPFTHVPLTPEFKYVGGIHGNEVTGKELLLRLAVYLCEAYNSGDASVKQLIETTRIHILPALNPDGWELATASSYADRNQVTGRSNNNSVDLNRSYPKLDHIWWNNAVVSPWRNHHLYANLNETLHLFEPETQAMMQWLEAVPFVLSAALHGGDLVANYPFDASATGRGGVRAETPDHPVFTQISHMYADHHPSMRKSKCYPDEPGFSEGITNGAEWYELRGGMQDYHYLATNCFEITLEVGCLKYPAAHELHSIWLDNKSSLMHYMWQTHLGIKGIVYDEQTGIGIPDTEIQVSILTEHGYEPIWHFVTTGRYGDYYRLLVDGKYEVVANKDGYLMEKAIVIVTNILTDGAIVANFALRQNDVI